MAGPTPSPNVPINMNAPAPTPEEQIGEALTAGQGEKASKILLDLLHTESNQAREELRIFAQHYGPLVARTALKKQAALAAGDTIAAEECDLDLQEIIAQAKMRAALLGVKLQSHGENLLGNVLGAAFGALVKLI